MGGLNSGICKLLISWPYISTATNSSFLRLASVSRRYELILLHLWIFSVTQTFCFVLLMHEYFFIVSVLLLVYFSFVVFFLLFSLPWVADFKEPSLSSSSSHPLKQTSLLRFCVVQIFYQFIPSRQLCSHWVPTNLALSVKVRIRFKMFRCTLIRIF